MEFDKDIFKNNVTYLAKKKNIKMGELEEKIGVSKGYISRISKKNNGVATGVDIVMKIAREFGVTMDVLVSVDLQEIGDNEQYLINLMKRLESKTDSNVIFWKKIEPSTVKNILDGVETTDMPMFTIKPGTNYYDLEPDQEAPKIYKSEYVDQNLVQETNQFPAGSWFKTNIDKYTTIFISYMIYPNRNELDKEVLEIYLQTAERYTYVNEFGGDESGYRKVDIPLCCSLVMGEEVDNAISSLYRTILSHQNDIKIPKSIKNILDSFMSD